MRWIKDNWRPLFQASVVVFVLTIIGIALLDRSPVVEAAFLRFEEGNGKNGEPIYAGSEVHILWSAREIRHGCGGEIFQLWIDSEGTVFDIPTPDPVPVRYSGGDDKPHPNSRLRIVPAMKPGVGVFTPRAKRWCPAGNLLQHYIWPMWDKLPEVEFTVSPKS